MLRVSEDGNRRRDGYLANYKQLRNSLIDLQNAADKIFDTISQRTAKESEKLIALSKRIHNAKARIDAIAHSKQAIAIRSSSRYPSCSNGDKDFRPLFGYKDGTSDVDFPIAELLVNGGLKRDFGADGTLELFQFFSETTSDFRPKEVRSMAGSEVTHSNGNVSIENLLELPNFTYHSFLKEVDVAAHTSPNPGHQMLPPPPPSLLHNSQEAPNDQR